MLSDFLFYKALLPASGGGSSGDSGGATTVVYHADQDYINSGDDNFLMLKISDLAPTAEELSGGFCIMPYRGSSISFAAHPFTVVVSEFGPAILVDDFEVAVVISKELAANVFGDETLAGFYFRLSSDEDAWFCWEKK